MGEILTIAEIRARFAPDWVLLGDIETDDQLEILSGLVLGHGPDRDHLCRLLQQHPAGRYALEFLGEFPKDLVLVL